MGTSTLVTIEELEKPLLVDEFSVVVVVVSKELTEEEVVDTCVWLVNGIELLDGLIRVELDDDMTLGSLEW